MVNVVNEPTHDAPSASVRAAMGGDTNWAWVKYAFERAKYYRPSGCKLLINEYDVEKSSSVRSTYKTIIQMLKNNSLIDGIGTHAHFLEGTATSTIQTALNELDDFGLPLYITEYDVNSSNDTTQKNVYISQFPVF